jgi:hypothetical protein
MPIPERMNQEEEYDINSLSDLNVHAKPWTPASTSYSKSFSQSPSLPYPMQQYQQHQSNLIPTAIAQIPNHPTGAEQQYFYLPPQQQHQSQQQHQFFYSNHGFVWGNA